MNDMGLEGAEPAGEIEERAEIEPGMNGSNERGDEVEGERGAGGLGFERSFGAGCGAGEEVDFKVMVVVEALNRGEGIFLGAADDEASDDVGDTHPGGGVRWSFGQDRSSWRYWATCLASSVSGGAC
jgi:hypothetical protein